MELRLIDENTPRDRLLLLYYPPQGTGARREAMWLVSFLGATPHRTPSHFAELPQEPALDTLHEKSPIRH